MSDRQILRPAAMLLLLLVCGLVAWRDAPPYKADLDAVLELWADILRDVDQLGYKVTRMSDQAEMELGGEILPYLSPVRWAHDSRAEYVQAVGARLTPHVRRPHITYSFHVEVNPAINAFALPGGHIVVFTGLLEFLDSEDELASVIGHEISHVDLRHCVEHYQLIEAAEKLKLGTAATIAVIAAELAHRIYSLQYSKYQEAEADAQGARLIAQAGYDPGAASAVFARMGAEFGEPEPGKPRTPLGEVGSSAKRAVGGYFSTHPQSADRASRLADLSRHYGAYPHPPPAGKLEPEAYREKVGKNSSTPGRAGEASTTPSAKSTDRETPPDSSSSAPQSPRDAVRERAEGGDPEAQTTLALRYLQGDGLAAEQSAAVALLAAAAVKAHARAQYTLARLYHEGRGVPRNAQAAEVLVRAAAASNYAPAQYTLAGILLRGTEPDSDTEAAYALLLAAAEQGLPRAQFRVGQMLEAGRGHAREPAGANYWYRRAAEMGDARAQLWLSDQCGREEGSSDGDLCAYRWAAIAAQTARTAAVRRAALASKSELGRTLSDRDRRWADHKVLNWMRAHPQAKSEQDG